MSHQWLAEWFLPEYQVEEGRLQIALQQYSQIGDISQRPAPPITNSGDQSSPEEPKETETTKSPLSDEEAFYELFWELNRTSFEEYLKEHPETLDDGWDNIYINEAGFYDEGTTIYTSMGEQVLAIDAKNKLLLVRVEDSGYLGILAIGKDPAQLRCEPSAGIGDYGQSLEVITKNSGGLVGITGSGFYDPDGIGNGGIIAGYAMCEGESHGAHYTTGGYKRIELTRDNKMYITDSTMSVASDVTDAVEFYPALVVDGKVSIFTESEWSGTHPRACIGQSERDEILLLVIEGRQVGRSIGTDLDECAKILMRHDAYNALNLDGGTSAVMWYDGEYVTRCSNRDIDSRYLPNAWVYGNYE